MGVDHRRHGIRRVMESIDEFKSQCNQQGHGQQEKCETRGMMHMAYVRDQMREGIHNPDCKNRCEDEDPSPVWSLIDLGVDRASNAVGLFKLRRRRCGHHVLPLESAAGTPGMGGCCSADLTAVNCVKY